MSKDPTIKAADKLLAAHTPRRCAARTAAGKDAADVEQHQARTADGCRARVALDRRGPARRARAAVARLKPAARGRERHPSALRQAAGLHAASNATLAAFVRLSAVIALFTVDWVPANSFVAAESWMA